MVIGLANFMPTISKAGNGFIKSHFLIRKRIEQMRYSEEGIATIGVVPMPHSKARGSTTLFSEHRLQSLQEPIFSMTMLGIILPLVPGQLLPCHSSRFIRGRFTSAKYLPVSAFNI